ncbi:uncharacterized protein PRCAT00005545001 [Priceomyces carsonii]|uniref:uncharacterized protein n=1 Tax=Priceomyces carsonii TaxID=28549 RepID=UPI002ED9CEB5|nr:unnamed protein product [Priceomyces carsonii]
MALSEYGLVESNNGSVHTYNPLNYDDSAVIRDEDLTDQDDELSPLNPMLDSNFNRRVRKFNRKSSVIIANTGERVHRTISLTSSSSPNLDESQNEPSLLVIVLAWHRATKMYYDETFRCIAKCSIAYLIASLGVYCTPFNNFLGKSDFKHVVATVAVYFHPARSKGSMHQTLGFVVVSFIFSFSVCFGCRSVSSYFFNRGLDEVSYTIDLFVSSFCLGIIAYMKQRVGKQTFNTACSLASISVVGCIVKEGSNNSSDVPIERLQSTLLIIVTGCMISVAVCYLLWPVSATEELKISLKSSFAVMSSVLSLVATRFLAGDKLTTSDTEHFNLLDKHVKKIKTDLEEARYELILRGKENEWLILQGLVNIAVSLSQHLRALKSSLDMEGRLLHNISDDTSSFTSLSTYASDIRLTESVENMANIEIPKIYEDQAYDPEQLFNLFVQYLAPPIRSFIFTIKGILCEVPSSSRASIGSFIQTTSLQNSLQDAVDLFDRKQISSFEDLYSQDIFKTSNATFKASQEEVTACCGNFSSILKLFAQKLMVALKLTEQYELSKSDKRDWSWIINCWRQKSSEDLKTGGTFEEALADLQSHLHSQKSDKQSFSLKLWRLLRLFKTTNVKVGMRVGLGALFLSFFAFYPRTKPTFNHYRGEWSLAIYCFMMNKSVGGTSMTVKWRIIGTTFGACTAVVIWVLTGGNGIALALTGLFISSFSFYIILFWKQNNAFGRFILLTYNLTALYSYSMTQQDSEDGQEGGDNPVIGEIAFHRFISVSVGIIWALIMASCFLPNSARVRLKNALTVLWLRLGVIWNSDPLEYDHLSHLLVGLKEQTGADTLLSECLVLLKQAPLELRLKGSFPKKIYEKLILSTSNVLDAFQNMNLMIKVDPLISKNEQYVLEYLAAEREELEHRIFLIFYLIASAMRLNFPLPGKPVSTLHARDRMLVKLNDIRSLHSTDIILTNEDYVLLYSYILVSTTISYELEKITQLIQKLFGDVSEDVFQLS